MAVLFLVCNSQTALAVEIDDSGIVYEELSPVPPKINGGISMYDISKPPKDSVYPNNTQNNVYGETLGVPLYTNSCFYGVKKITGSIINDSSKDLKVTLYYYLGFAGIKSTKYATISAGNKGTFSFEGLNLDTYYYLQFDGVELDFHGFVGGISG